MAKKKTTPAKDEPTRELWGWRLQRKGAFLVGVPAGRDIPHDEAKEKGIAAKLDESTLYRRDYVEVTE